MKKDYDKAIDVITDKLYNYLSKYEACAWDKNDAKEVAHDIIKTVEEFQNVPNIPRWRASD